MVDTYLSKEDKKLIRLATDLPPRNWTVFDESPSL